MHGHVGHAHDRREAQAHGRPKAIMPCDKIRDDRRMTIVETDKGAAPVVGEQVHIPEVPQDLDMLLEVRTVGRRGDEAAAGAGRGSTAAAAADCEEAQMVDPEGNRADSAVAHIIGGNDVARRHGRDFPCLDVIQRLGRIDAECPIDCLGRRLISDSLRERCAG